MAEVTSPSENARVTLDRADELKARALELREQSYALAREADEAEALAAIELRCGSLRGELLAAEIDLDAARSQLAEASEAYEPLAVDLAAVTAELAKATTSGAAKALQKLPLKRRLEARAHLAACQAEAADLAPAADEARTAVKLAENLVHTATEAVEWCRRELAEAEAMAEHLPMGDLARLSQIAPTAAMAIALRVGLAKLMLPDPDMTPDTRRYLQAELLAACRWAGLSRLIAEEAWRQVGKFPPGYFEQKQLATLPPAPPAGPSSTDAELARTQASIRGSVPQVGDVPAQPVQAITGPQPMPGDRAI